MAIAIADEDRPDAVAHNASAPSERCLQIGLGPVPCVGAIMTAPVVLLLSRPQFSPRSTPDDYAFRRVGWPLAALHPDAPAGPAEWWRSRVAALVDMFGAQHVANAVAAVFLTPWHSTAFDERLRLPSRQRTLELGASAARRDAILILMQEHALWTEHPDIASLPVTRCVRARSWRGTELSRRNVGEAWSALCKRIEVHAWL